MHEQRIAFFIHSLAFGGIQKIVVRMSNEFTRRGYRVDLVVAKGLGPLADDLEKDVRLINLQSRSIWKALPNLLRYIRRERPNVLFSAEAPVNLVAIWARILSGTTFRLIVSVRSNMTQYSRSTVVWYAKYIPFLIRVFYRFADAVVTVSKGVRDDLATISQSAVGAATVIYNPIVDPARDQVDGSRQEHPLPEGDTEPVILAVGRLTNQKNFPLLLNAFKAVREDIPANLMILGDGPLRQELEALAKDLGISNQVHFAGFVADPDPYFRNADLFVLTSDYEGFGSVIVEALSHGCPVVSTDCPSGPREILQDGAFGTLVPVGDQHALSEAIVTALEDDHDPKRLIERSRDFSINRAIEKYLTVFFPNT